MNLNGLKHEMTRMYYFPTHLPGMVSVEVRWLELLAGPASPAPAKDEPRPAVAVQLAAGAVQLLQCCNGVQCSLQHRPPITKLHSWQ